MSTSQFWSCGSQYLQKTQSDSVTCAYWQAGAYCWSTRSRSASHSCLSICPKGLMSQSNGTRHSLIGRTADGVDGKSGDDCQVQAPGPETEQRSIPWKQSTKQRCNPSIPRSFIRGFDPLLPLPNSRSLLCFRPPSLLSAQAPPLARSALPSQSRAPVSGERPCVPLARPPLRHHHAIGRGTKFRNKQSPVAAVTHRTSSSGLRQALHSSAELCERCFERCGCAVHFVRVCHQHGDIILGNCRAL